MKACHRYATNVCLGNKSCSACQARRCLPALVSHVSLLVQALGSEERAWPRRGRPAPPAPAPTPPRPEVAAPVRPVRRMRMVVFGVEVQRHSRFVYSKKSFEFMAASKFAAHRRPVIVQHGHVLSAWGVDRE